MTKEQMTIKVNIQETELFQGMCAIMNEMFIDKRIPEIYKKKISNLIKKSVKK